MRPFLTVLLLLAACAPAPSLEALYAPLREAHAWSYHVKRTGLGATFEDSISLETQPQPDGSSLLNVHLLPNANDPKVGARHTYRLDFSSLPPKLIALKTEAGRGTFEPGLPFPDFLESRGKGAQMAVLAQRLVDAKARGCTIALMVTAVGSTSQRNAERNGFRVAYTRTKWRRTKSAL